MPKLVTLSVCVETSYRQTSAFVFLRDNRQNAEFGISSTTVPYLLLEISLAAALRGRKQRSAQFTKRSNWSTVNARMPNIKWHCTLRCPRTRTCRAPNSSFSRPLTRSTVDRSR